MLVVKKKKSRVITSGRFQNFEFGAGHSPPFLKQLIYLTAKNKHHGREKEKVCKPNAHDALKAIVGEVVRGGREVRGSKATTAAAMSSSDWRRFFAEAGIPAAAAEQYATNFAENRISMDMLLELNKDYLRDLGIFVLGDIIAILRHAKAVQGKMTRSVTLAPNASSSVSASAAAVTTTAATTSTSVSTSPGAEQAARKTHTRVQVTMHTVLISCYWVISNLFVFVVHLLSLSPLRPLRRLPPPPPLRSPLSGAPRRHPHLLPLQIRRSVLLLRASQRPRSRNRPQAA